MLRGLFVPVLFCWRRPRRALGVLVLLLLVGAAVGAIGVFLWTGHHLRAARRASELGHNTDAIRHLRKCRLVRPDQAEVLLLSARAARRSGVWSDVEQLLDRYWRIYGDDDALVLERLLFQATRGEVEESRSLLQAHIDADDAAAPLAREALAAGLLQRFRLKEAQQHIDRWLDSDPDSTLALLARGKLHQLREQSSEALLTYRRILELDADHDLARLRLTTVLLQLSQGEEALDHLEFLRRRLPDHPEVLTQLGQAMDLQDRADEARAVLDSCLRDNPDHAAALAERGRIARRDGDTELAEELLRRAIQIEPGKVTARYQFSLVLNQNGKPAEAAKEQEAIRQLEADAQRIHELLHYRLQQTPNDPAIHYEIAMIALRGGLPRDALRWLQSALQVGPDHETTHRALATYYHETGNPILSARHRAIAQRLANRDRSDKVTR